MFCSDWFTALFASVAIGWSNCFGFGSMTLNKLLKSALLATSLSYNQFWQMITLKTGQLTRDLLSFQDEDSATSWMLIQENDLIALFSQFPFDAIFKHLLKMDPNIPSKELFKTVKA